MLVNMWSPPGVTKMAQCSVPRPLVPGTLACSSTPSASSSCRRKRPAGSSPVYVPIAAALSPKRDEATRTLH